MWKVKVMTHMAADKRACAGKFCFIKPSDLVRFIHCHENSMENTHPMIQLPPTQSLPQHVGIVGVTIQDEICVGTQPNHIRGAGPQKDQEMIRVLDFQPHLPISGEGKGVEG